MRISDWSSDVCSSDLLAVHFGAARQQQCAVELVPVGLLRVPPDQDLALKDAARTIVEYPHIDFARAAFRHRMIDEGGVVYMLLAAQHVGAVEAARSEEHTSELQSLMRISYAVFCLKNKTKTHKR